MYKIDVVIEGEKTKERRRGARGRYCGGGMSEKRAEIGYKDY
jgi:hypothetical protein